MDQSFSFKKSSRDLVCEFCSKKTSPDYKQYKLLSRYLSDRARILPRDKTGVCAAHQRALAREIKRARYLALLPFIPKVG